MCEMIRTLILNEKILSDYKKDNKVEDIREFCKVDTGAEDLTKIIESELSSYMITGIHCPGVQDFEVCAATGYSAGEKDGWNMFISPDHILINDEPTF